MTQPDRPTSSLRPQRSRLPFSARPILRLAGGVLALSFSGSVSLVSAGSAAPAAAAGAPAVSRSATPAATFVGSIQGRVFNAATGSALGNARVALEGTRREVLTDEAGFFQFDNIPAGGQRLQVSYLGFQRETVPLTVVAGELVRREVDLLLLDAKRPLSAEEVVQLETFNVTESREMSAQAIAMNEQRAAANIKSVVAYDEYGDRGDENVGEFLRFLPSVALNDSGLVPNEVTLRGFPSNHSGITVNGNELTGARSGNTRSISLLEVPTAGISRVEVTKVPTPDMPASGLGGSINLITKSGFERRTPQFDYQVYQLFNTGDSSVFGGGPRAHVGGTSPSHKQPSFSFAYLRPVNRNLAISVGGSRTWRQKPQEGADESPTWNLVDGFLRTSEWQWLAQVMTSVSGNVGVEWRLTPRDLLSFGAQYRETSSYITRSNLVMNYGTGATGGANWVRGAATGVGTVTMNDGANSELINAMNLVSLSYTHRRENWRVDASGSTTRATYEVKDIDNGHFNTTPATLSSVVLSGEGINQGATIPTSYSVTTRTGTPVDLYDGRNYTLNTVSSGQAFFPATRSVGKLSFTRDFDWSVPFSLKTGIAYDHLQKKRRTFNRTWTFTPRDGSGAASSKVAGGYDLFYDDFSLSMYGRPVGWISHNKAFALYEAHPDWFVLNDATTHQNDVTNSLLLIERISSAYVRGDVRALRNRLWIAAGVRYERTSAYGEGPLNDPSNQYRKDANGNVIDGNPGTAGVQPILITTDALERAKLRYVERGARARRVYDDYYPSINASYALGENLLVRAAYARTIGRPNTNFITPGATFSEPTATQPTITVNNTGLKPWTADNFDLSLETYNLRGGVGSVGVFRKNIADFFGSVTARATPELLEQYGLPADPLYLNYDIQTTTNAGDARIDGLEFSYRQSLTFLPHWARGFQVFFNTTRMRLSGSATADFTGFNRSNLSAGLHFIRPRYFIKATCTYQGETRRSIVAVSTANGIGADTYNYQGARTRLGLSAQYSFSKRLAVYGSITDLGGGFNPLSLRYAPTTPDYARKYRYQELGSTITIGIKGQF